jgi:hypothetical protein
MRVGAIVVAAVFGLLGCGSTPTNQFTLDDGGGVDGSTTDDGDIVFPDAGGDGGQGACKNLQCQQVNCGGGATTSLSGTVVTGTLPKYGSPDPVYNAVVYVPNAPVDKFKPGVACDQCGAPASGSPVVVTLTDAAGHFKLDNVPVGTDIPLVIQVGRWRRQVVIPTVAKCVDTPLVADMTRLPRNHNEGDIPHIAIASSTYDAEECILRKMGVDDAEFTNAAGPGRIHIYHGTGTTLAGATDMSTLWSSVSTLSQYDIVQFPCYSVSPDPSGVPGQNVKAYADAGGRVFVTDLAMPWFKNGPAPFPTTASWNASGFWSSIPTTVDQSFPKGKALAQWLQNIGATTTLGSINLNEVYGRADAALNGSTRWLYAPSMAMMTYSFNTPVGAKPENQCGRAVYSSFHIANGQPGSGTTFPAECSSSPLSAQEKVMEFLLLDIASCIQVDTTPPIPPPN